MTWKHVAGAVVAIALAWALLRGGRLAPPQARLPESELIEVISRGESVDLGDHVAARGWTIVEFTADW